MLSPDEQHFLDHLPPDLANKKIVIKPYSPKLKEAADKIIDSLRSLFPDLDIRFMGASGLGISGQNDIDIYALAREKDFPHYRPGMEKLFGLPTGSSPGSLAWKFVENGFDTELYLTDPGSPTMQKQIRVFAALKNSPVLLKEYEDLKQNLNGSAFREYQTQKYEFYHRILGDRSL